LYRRFLEAHGSQLLVRLIGDCTSDEIFTPIEIIKRLYDGTVSPKGNGYCREYVDLIARRERATNINTVSSKIQTTYLTNITRRHYATKRKVAGTIPDEVIAFFN
jgi:hypothetical protein